MVKQPLCRRHGHHYTDFPTTTGLTENGHIASIAAEVFDVGAYPLKGKHGIQQSGDTRAGKCLTGDICQV